MQEFNKIMAKLEKSRGGARYARQMVFDANLIDLGFQGQKFTWINRRYMGVLVKERIDRGFSLNLWLTTFLCTQIELVLAAHCYYLGY